MMEFILWVIFTKLVSQVVVIKKIAVIEKIVIIEKDHDHWKRLWWLKKIVIIKKINACDKINLVVIKMRLLRQFSTLYFFFYESILHAQKASKSTKSTKNTKT